MSKDAEQQFINNIPLRKLGEVNQISGVAAFLVSDDASYITGETVVAAGGAPSHLWILTYMFRLF